MDHRGQTRRIFVVFPAWATCRLYIYPWLGVTVLWPECLLASIRHIPAIWSTIASCWPLSQRLYMMSAFFGDRHRNNGPGLRGASGTGNFLLCCKYDRSYGISVEVTWKKYRRTLILFSFNTITAVHVLVLWVCVRICQIKGYLLCGHFFYAKNYLHYRRNKVVV